MEHDNSDDPWGFWNDEPTRPLKRAHVGTRAHGETGMVPVVRTQRAKAVPDVPRQRNPLMTRVCVMVGVMLLCVPIALTLRQGTQHAKAAEVQGVDTVFVGKMPPAPTDVTLAPDTAAPSTLVTTTAAQATTAAPATPAPTVAALATAAPTAPPTTAKVVKKKVVVAKPTTTTAPPPTTATQAVAKVACTQTYTVASGDAWSTIAARAKVSMTSLLAANRATTQTLLLAGKKICLPAGAVIPGPPTTKPPTTTTTKPPATKPPTTPPKVTAPPTTKPSTTPTVTTAPAPTQPPPPANTYTKAQVAQIIRDVWPDDLEDQAIAIATRESSLIPTVRNYCCYGLFQIYFTANQSFLAGLGITNAAQLYDPRVNATAALAMYNRSGWAPWALPTTTSTVVLS
jgi:LysM repeat protein